MLRATARPVCQAFLDAMRIYGVPDEVLSDNGTVFTGRFIKPRPAEVLFERICRENGITQRLTKPASSLPGRRRGAGLLGAGRTGIASEIAVRMLIRTGGRWRN